jgi:hypothetical protein
MGESDRKPKPKRKWSPFARDKFSWGEGDVEAEPPGDGDEAEPDEPPAAGKKALEGEHRHGFRWRSDQI